MSRRSPSTPSAIATAGSSWFRSTPDVIALRLPETVFSARSSTRSLRRVEAQFSPSRRGRLCETSISVLSPPERSPAATDEDGDALAGVRIQLLRSRYLDGKPQLTA